MDYGLWVMALHWVERSFCFLSENFLRIHFFFVIFSMILRSLLYLYLYCYLEEYGMGLPSDG